MTAPAEIAAKTEQTVGEAARFVGVTADAARRLLGALELVGYRLTSADEVAALTQERDTAKSLMHMAHEEAKQLVAERDTLRADLARVRADQAHAGTLNERLHAELATMEADLTTANEARDRWHAMYDELFESTRSDLEALATARQELADIKARENQACVFDVDAELHKATPAQPLQPLDPDALHSVLASVASGDSPHKWSVGGIVDALREKFCVSSEQPLQPLVREAIEVAVRKASDESDTLAQFVQNVTDAVMQFGTTPQALQPLDRQKVEAVVDREIHTNSNLPPVTRITDVICAKFGTTPRTEAEPRKPEHAMGHDGLEWPHTRDGMLWAVEFNQRFPSVSVDNALGWFCNAIMRGHDWAKQEPRTEAECVKGLVEMGWTDGEQVVWVPFELGGSTLQQRRILVAPTPGGA